MRGDGPIQLRNRLTPRESGRYWHVASRAWDTTISEELVGVVRGRDLPLFTTVASDALPVVSHGFLWIRPGNGRSWPRPLLAYALTYDVA
jgi:hypothetical protein